MLVFRGSRSILNFVFVSCLALSDSLYIISQFFVFVKGFFKSFLSFFRDFFARFDLPFSGNRCLLFSLELSYFLLSLLTYSIHRCFPELLPPLFFRSCSFSVSLYIIPQQIRFVNYFFESFFDLLNINYTAIRRRSSVKQNKQQMEKTGTKSPDLPHKIMQIRPPDPSLMILCSVSDSFILASSGIFSSLVCSPSLTIS